MTTKSTDSAPSGVSRTERDCTAIRLVGYILVRAASAERRLARRLKAQASR